MFERAGRGTARGFRWLVRPRTDPKTAGVELLGFSLLSTGVSFIRSMFVARLYGVTHGTDAFYAAMNVVSVPVTLVSDASTALVQPEYLKQRRRASFVASYTIVLSVIAGCIALLLLLFGDPILRMVAAGLPPAEMRIAHTCLLLFVPMALFVPLAAFYDGVLRAEGQFFWGNLGRLLNALLALGGLLLFFNGSLTLLVYTAVAGLAANLLIYFLPLRRFLHDAGDRELLTGLGLLARGLPLLAGGVVGIVTTFFERRFASFLAPGSITLLNMAVSLTSVLKGVFAGAVISGFYPFVAAAVARGDDAAYTNINGKARSLIFGIFGTAVALGIASSRFVLAILYGHGRFPGSAVISLAGLFNALLFGVVFSASSALLNFTYYSLGETRLPVLTATVTIGVLYVALEALLYRTLGIQTFGLVFVITGVFCLVGDTLWLRLLKRRVVLRGRDLAFVLLIAGMCTAGLFYPDARWLLLLPPVYAILAQRAGYLDGFNRVAWGRRWSRAA